MFDQGRQHTSVVTHMLAAVGALVEMQGIVRMMCQIATGWVFEQKGDRAVLKNIDGLGLGTRHAKALPRNG